MANKCAARRNKGRTQCTEEAELGQKFCTNHLKMFAMRNLSKVRQVEEVERKEFRPNSAAILVKAGLISNEDAEANGAFALMMEIRRTVARIRFCDVKINELEDDEMVWGTTRVQDEEGYREKGPISVHTVTKESAVSQWVLLQRWERTHLAKLSKMWIDAGFEQKRLDLQARTVEGLNTAIREIITGLGRDPYEVGVKKVVSRALSKLRKTEIGD